MTRRIFSQLRAMFGKPDELKRPSFPVDDKYREKRGEVNDVKPLCTPRVTNPKHVSTWGWDGNGSPIDYEDLPV